MNSFKRYGIILFLLLQLQILIAMKTVVIESPMTSAIIYLAKTDSIYIDIKNKVWNDWVKAARNADPASEENKLKKAQMDEWPSEKQERFQTFAMKTIRDYNKETDFDVDYFMMFFGEVLNFGQKKLEGETDFRVRSVGSHKYIAEFWEDGLAANSDANAVARAKELAESPRAKMHPEEDLGNVAEIKKTFAEARKAITTGKQKRFTKLMSLLYVQEADKNIVFKDPFQPLYDFK
jgi:hypothetical protein